MARLNPNYKHTITLFNCLKGADNPNGGMDVWYKTVIPDCFFKCLMTAVSSGTSSSMAGSYTSRIPASVLYLKYSDWCKLTEATRGHYFTGNVGDVIVLGTSTDIISNTSPNASSQVLNRNKPNAFKVTAFSDNSAGMEPHYRYGG